MQKYKNIDEYIHNFPPEVQSILQQVRAVIQKIAPQASEAIAYGIPTFKLNGNLVHFAGYEHHIGFYPGAEAIEEFAQDLKKYKTSKGTIQFSLTGDIPYDLLEKITIYRVQKNLSKATSHSKAQRN